MGRLCVYVVEDNPTIRDNLVSALDDLVQAKVAGTAETEDEAEVWLTEHQAQWDLAIVDLFLKEGNGLSLLERLPPPPVRAGRVVVLTNYANLEVRRLCLAAGADQVFDKSTEIEDFLDYCAVLARSSQSKPSAC